MYTNEIKRIGSSVIAAGAHSPLSRQGVSLVGYLEDLLPRIHITAELRMAKESSHLTILPLISTYIRIISTYIQIRSAYFIAAASVKHMHPLTSHSLGNMPEGEDDNTTSNCLLTYT